VLITVADEEKQNLKKDDVNFPWGIGGTDNQTILDLQLIR